MDKPCPAWSRRERSSPPAACPEMVSDRVLPGAGRCLQGISSDPCSHPAVGALGQARTEREAWERPRTLSRDSVSSSREGPCGDSVRGSGAVRGDGSL